VHAALIALSLMLQILCMARLLKDPKKFAPWYNATGVTLYVMGMLAAAFAVRGGV
jgi:chlorophyll/bacteriochlorophyll a synthase